MVEQESVSEWPRDRRETECDPTVAGPDGERANRYDERAEPDPGRHRQERRDEGRDAEGDGAHPDGEASGAARIKHLVPGALRG